MKTALRAAGGVLLALTAALAFPAAAQATDVNRSPDKTEAFSPEANQASYWGENCVKYDQFSDPYDLTVEAKLIIKSATVNDIWYDAQPGLYGTASGKAISHVIVCPIASSESPSPRPSESSPEPTPTETTATPEPSETTATPTPSESTDTPTPTPSESTPTPTPSESTSTPAATPSYSEVGGCVPTAETPCELPKTGSAVSALSALAAGLLALGGTAFYLARRKGTHA